MVPNKYPPGLAMFFGDASLYLKNMQLANRNIYSLTHERHRAKPVTTHLLSASKAGEEATSKVDFQLQSLAELKINPIEYNTPLLSRPTIPAKKRPNLEFLTGMIQGHAKPLVSLISTTETKPLFTNKSEMDFQKEGPAVTDSSRPARKPALMESTDQRPQSIKRRLTFNMPVLPTLQQVTDRVDRSQKIIKEPVIRGTRLLDYCPKSCLFCNQSWQDEQARACPGEMTAEAYCILDIGRRRTLFKKNANEPLEMASLTKIITCFTALLIFEKHSVGMDTKVRVSDEAGGIEGTVAGLKPGDLLTVEQLLYGLMLPSGNDAALAIAEFCGKVLHKYKCNRKQLRLQGWQKGKTPPPPKYMKNFFWQMNKVARDLGLKNSQFCSPHGLSHEDNVSTASELCHISAAALQHPMFSKVVLAKEFSLTVFNERSGLTRAELWTNSNRLLREHGFEGIKTGNTPAAGPCFAGYYRGEKELVSVVLNTSSCKSRFRETQRLVQESLRDD